MYRILLVDDDSIARVRLKNLLQWESLNCRIVAEASCGREAVAKIERCHPQIVITDIDMPDMNGVDLIHYAKKHYPEVYIVALSAYDDFDYVRDSLKYGAMDYVLKHQLTPRKLETTLQEAFEHVKDPEAEPSKEETGAKKELLHILLRPEEKSGDSVNLVENFQGESFLLAAGKLQMEDFSRDDRKRKYLEGIISETLLLYEWKVFWEFYGESLIVLFAVKSHIFRKDILEILDQVKENSRRYMGLELTFRVSELYNNIWLTSQKLKSLSEGCPEEEVWRERTGVILQIGETQELEQLLEKESKGKLHQCLERLFARLQSSAGTSMQVSIVAAELCNVLLRDMQEISQRQRLNSLSGEKVLLLQEKMTEMSRKIKRMLQYIQEENDLSTVQELIMTLYDDYLRSLRKKGRPDYGNVLINESVAWIEGHCEEAISLRDVADALNINSAYLSRLFKKYTGKTIVTFINELKMERAKEMIEEGKTSLKEIALTLGFQNYNYFYRLYKEIYGVSPSDNEIENKR